MASQICQNYHQDCEAAVNKQINLELTASYLYQSLMSYFDRDDVALHHFSQFFKDQSQGKQEHAEKLLKFQNQRGGRVLLQDVKKPERDEWGNGLQAMQVALSCVTSWRLTIWMRRLRSSSDLGTTSPT
ncbi:ferritin, heavy subunit-like [Chiloscyllium punctatum]|uniref:ferritin, heavy subunit-like n=1 Tax=Chiloscyllium punctatum TaxID=137246 RepID=UPI003B635EB6